MNKGIKYLVMIVSCLTVLAAGPKVFAASCNGKQVTILGTAGNDILRGSSGPDVISGLGGNDTIKGRGGNDVICGGPGKDKIYGGSGKDKLYGGSGNDRLDGGSGLDFCDGGPGRDTAISCERMRSIPPTIKGTAAKGAAIASATVTVKDKNGVTNTGTTDANGKYAIDVTGLTAPFLLRIDLADGTALYSVGSAAGVVNIHPFTDLIIQTWYKVKGTTIEAGFNDPVGNPPPDVTAVQTIAEVTKEVIEIWLVESGIDPAQFDLITTPFDANNVGFDLVLAQSTVMASGTVTITDGTATQTSAITVDPNTSSTTVNTTTTTGAVSSSSVTSTVIPTTSDQKTAMEGVQKTLNQFKDIVNSKGDLLADSDLIGLYDSNFLHEGGNRNIHAANIVTDMRGMTVNSITVDLIRSYDSANKVISITGVASITQDGVTVGVTVEGRLGGDDDDVILRGQPDGSWLFYGNQQITSTKVKISIDNRMNPSCTNCPNPVKNFRLATDGLVGTISGVTVSGDGQNYTLAKNTIQYSQTLEPTPGVFTEIKEEEFSLSCPSNCNELVDFPPAGTVYTFSVTPADGSGVRTYTDSVQANTTETISITSLATSDGTASVNDHTLASVKGKTVTVQWTLPTTFPVADVELKVFVFAGTNGCDLYSDGLLSPTSTSGTITIPTQCGGEDVVALPLNGPMPASINVDITGTHGEVTRVQFPFR